MTYDGHVKEVAGTLLAEMDEFRLEVILVPASEPRHSGHRIRAAVNRNPAWYSNMYHSHRWVRRGRTEDALRRIAKGKAVGSRFEDLVMEEIDLRLGNDHYDEHGNEILAEYLV